MTELENGEIQGSGVTVVGTTTRRPVGPSAAERGKRRRSTTRGGDSQPEAAVSTEPLTEVAGHSSTSSLRRRRVVSTGALLGLMIFAVVAAVAGICFGFAWSALNSQNQQRQAVKQAATTFLLDLTNVKPTTVDADFSALENWAAPGSVFAKQAAQTFNSNIRQGLIQAQSTSQGQIRSLFVETIGGSSAEVYAVVDQAYQNSKMTSPQSDTLRLTLDMTDTAQGWRISAVTVENPSGTTSPTG